MSNFINYGAQYIDDADIKKVIDALRSSHLTQGPLVPEFEEKFCQYTTAQYSIAINSATAALHIACLALNVGNGDIVWTSPNSFVASANCVLYCGAEVDFVDIDLETFNMCARKLEEKLISAKKINKLPKVVIPVHFAGQSCDMKAIFKLSQEYGFKIIEDASHAVGSEYSGNKVGCCKYSDIAVFSFHPVKMITTGEGGMALTNDKEIYTKMAILRSHGILRDNMKQNDKLITSQPLYYDQEFLGYNYRMTDFQAALGISQMDKLDLFVKKRSELAKYYDKKLENIGIKHQKNIQGCSSSHHLYVILLDINKKNKYFQACKKNNINLQLHYIPIYLHSYYKKLGFKQGLCPNAEKYYKETITLPLHFNINEDIIDRVIEILILR